MISGVQSSSSIDQHVLLYNTRSNIEQLIKELNLNVEFLESKPDDFIIKKIYVKDNSKIKNFRIIVNNNSEYSLYDLDKDEVLLKSGLVGIKYSDNLLDIEISELPTKKTEIDFIYYKNEYLIKLYSSLIKVFSITPQNFYNNTGGLLEVSLITDDPDLGIKIINTANKIFIDKNIEFKSEKASKAINFINERLSSLDKLVGSNRDKLNEFQVLNQTLNVDLEIQVILDKLSEIQTKITSLEVEEAKLKGIYTNSNPMYVNIQNQKKVLENERTLIENQIRSLPNSQQRYIDLYRDLEISQELYAELLNKRLSYSIIEASTMGNIRVINNAYNEAQVSPTILRIAISIIFGLFLGIFIALIKEDSFLQ